MSINTNVWEIAEAYLSGKMTEADSVALIARLEHDKAFSSDFHESINLIQSMKSNGKQKRFRELVKDIDKKAQRRAGIKKTARIRLTPQSWRTIGVAASVAILTSTITIWSLRPYIKKSDSQYTTISREVSVIKKVQAQQQAEQNKIKQDIKNNKTTPAPPPSDIKYAGTGFALTNDGYFVTANHVVHFDGKSEPDSVYIQNQDGQYFKATIIAFDAAADIAIMKAGKKSFRFGKGEIPYVFASDKADLGEDIFTLGYPNDALKYSKGYISSANGYNGNVQQYTLELSAGHGQSGSPVIGNDGSVVGILTAIGGVGESNNAATNTYAVSTKALMELVRTEIPEECGHLPRRNHLGSLGRTEQIQKVEPYTFSVLVYKK
jgi:S1-C subfamily serine protease